MFSKIRKPKGYPFDSVEIGRVVTTEEQERVVAQVDTTEAVESVNKIVEKYNINDDDARRLTEIATNCHGMIHIFAPSQVEYVDESVIENLDHVCDNECNHK